MERQLADGADGADGAAVVAVPVVDDALQPATTGTMNAIAAYQLNVRIDRASVSPRSCRIHRISTEHTVRVALVVVLVRPRGRELSTPLTVGLWTNYRPDRPRGLRGRRRQRHLLGRLVRRRVPLREWRGHADWLSDLHLAALNARPDRLPTGPERANIREAPCPLDGRGVFTFAGHGRLRPTRRSR